MSGFSLGFLNLSDTGPGGIVTAGSEASASLPATNLQNSQVTEIWRSKPEPTGFDPNLVWPVNRSIYVQHGAGAAMGFVALMSSNAVDPGPSLPLASAWRIRAHQTGVSNGDLKSRCHVAPASIAASTNLTGAVALAQDSPWNPDASWLTATSGVVNVTARFTFPVPASSVIPLMSGANLQTFVLWVRKGGGGGGTNPTVTLDLYQGGVLKQANLLVAYTVDQPLGQLIYGRWNAANLTSLTSSPELLVTAVHGSTQCIDIGAVMWMAEHNGYTYDSGQLTPVFPAYYAGTAAVRSNLLHVLPTPLPDFNPLSVTSTLVIDQFFSLQSFAEAGRLYCGPLWTPNGRSVDHGWAMRRIPYTIMGEPTLGGQLHPEVRPSIRELDGTLRYLTESEGYNDIFDKLDRRLGIAGDLIAIPDVANTAQFANQVIYGHLTELGQVMHMGWFNGAHKYQRRIVVQEYL